MQAHYNIFSYKFKINIKQLGNYYNRIMTVMCAQFSSLYLYISYNIYTIHKGK